MSRKVKINDNNDFYSFLCNLADQDNSIVIEAINKENEDLIARKEEAISNIVDLSRKLETAKSHLEILKDGNQKAVDFLFSYDNNLDLQAYFSLLGLDKDYLDEIRKAVYYEHNSKEISTKISNRISELTKEKKEQENIDFDCDEKLKRNRKKYESANTYTEDLKCLLDGAMNENGTFNKDYVTSLLNPIKDLANDYDIDFPDSYLDTSLKAIFFPNDGLFTVYNKYINGDKAIVDFEGENKIEEAKEVKEEKETILADTNEFSDIISTINDLALDDSVPEVEEEPVEEEVNEEIEEDKDVEATEEEASIEEVEEEEEEVEETVEEDNTFEKVDTPDIDDLIPTQEETNSSNNVLIDKYKLNKDLVSEVLLGMLEETNSNVINVNLETLKALNASDKVIYYVDGDYAYLTDKELVSKITILRGKGLNDKIINEVLENHYIDGSLESIKENIGILEENGIAFDKEYLPIINKDVGAYVRALKDLEEYGVEPDDKEKLQYLTLLTKYSDNVVPDTEVLKEYGISLLRKNGKYELGLYVNSPRDLQQAIDQIVETGEEELVNSVPEVLAMNANTIVERINYLKNNGIEYKDGKLYSDVIYRPLAFLSKYGDDIARLDDLDTSNKLLAEALQDEYSSILIEILDKYYKGNTTHISVELDDEERDMVTRFKTRFEEEYNALVVGKNTIKVDDLYISRNKFERNLKYLVSVLNKNGQEVENNYKEILLVSSLYNSRLESGKDFHIGDLNGKNVGGRSI